MPSSGHKVYLFADEFTNRQEAELGLTFARLLMHLGYSVEIPRHTESGRAAFSKGCLHLAKKYAVRNVQLLSGKVSEETPLVGIEPSCILSFRDEYPVIVPAQISKSACLGEPLKTSEPNLAISLSEATVCIISIPQHEVANVSGQREFALD